MSKFMGTFTNVLQKISAFTQTRYMKIMMDGFIGVSALSICGSLFTLLKSIPIQPWLDFLASSGLGDILSIPVRITTDVIAVHLLIALAYSTAKSFNANKLSSVLVALGSFFILTPFTTTIYNADRTVATLVSDVIPIGVLGARGMFLAIFVGIFATRFYIYLVNKGIKIKMPESVPEKVSEMFGSLIPGGLTFLLFLVIRYVFSITSYETVQNFIYRVLQSPLAVVGGGMIGFIIYRLVGHVLWMFGIHGSMVAYAGMAPIIALMTQENMAAFAAGVGVPHPEWAFMNLVAIGGSGCTLALNLLMLSPICKSKHFKTLGKLAIPTSLFNIGEPLMFGTPVIMNPVLAIPFIATPFVNLAICMAAYKIGFLIPTGASVSNFMPFGVNGMLTSASISGLIISIILIAADILIYLPFTRIADANAVKEEKARIAELQLAEAK